MARLGRERQFRVGGHVGAAMGMSHHQRESISQALNAWDATSVIVGIVVGVAIFKAPPVVFGAAGGPWQALGLWVVGGALSVVGALCYAELATSYPRSGGDYVYLTRAYGSLVGFLFGWADLAAILTGSIGALAFVFTDYATALWPSSRGVAGWVAASVVALLTLVNLVGVSVGKRVQNLLTAAKLLGLVAVIGAGLFGGQQAWVAAAAFPAAEPRYGLAMILVLYAYGGWNDAAFVAAEIRQPARNIPRALIAGVTVIFLIYVLTNVAYLSALGLTDSRSSPTPAADTLALVLGAWGFKGMCVLVMISALGALNGMIFAGARVHATMGADHRVFAWLARWHAHLGTPARSLLAQAAVSLLLILVVGTARGTALIDRMLSAVGLAVIPWQRFGGGFGALVSGTAPIFWLFFMLSGGALFVLRRRDRRIERPFAVPLYPLVPLAFCCSCAYMLVTSLVYARGLGLVMALPFIMGLPLYAASRWLDLDR